jgi:glyoxylase-like metal-dependent hydrolase (beta-lactamase superfamily II)
MPSKWTTKKGSIVTLTVSGRNNVYLIQSGTTVMLVDAGMTYMYNNMIAKIKKANVTPGTIVITHAHFDHAENTAQLKSHFNARVLVHSAEAAHLAAGVNPEDEPVAGTFTIEGENYPPVKADIIVQEVYEAGGGISVLHTPGHTPGSISVIVDDEIAVVGDAMFSVHPGQAMVPYVMDRKMLLNSWYRLFSTNCVIFLPAHGRPIERKTAEAEYKKYIK